jgi:hypothetical protein
MEKIANTTTMTLKKVVRQRDEVNYLYLSIRLRDDMNVNTSFFSAILINLMPPGTALGSLFGPVELR